MYSAIMQVITTWIVQTLLKHICELSLDENLMDGR